MTFDEVLEQVRRWLGSDVVVVLWLSEFGPAEGWLIDIEGSLARMDDPIADVDQPVHYVRFASGNGCALDRTRFNKAEWKTVAGERSLYVDFGAVSMSLSSLRAPNG